MIARSLALFLLLTVASLSDALGSEPAYALENARIVTMSGPVIESGTLVMRGGRIAAIGTDVARPADAIVIDASGWTLYPGFIDAHSTIGVSKPTVESALDAARRRERGDPAPGLRADHHALSSYDSDGKTMAALRRMGLAVANIAPSGGILQGQSAVVTLGDEPVQDRILREPWAQHVGYEPFSRQQGDYPGTLMGVMATLRQHFLDALWYRDAWARFEETPDTSDRPSFDESLDALAPAALSETPVVFSAWTDNALLRTLRLADELSLDVVVSGAVDGWRVADDLARSGVPVLVSLDQRPRRDPVGFGGSARAVVMERPGTDDEREARENPARLHEAGVSFAFTSLGLDEAADFLPSLRDAVKAGLPRNAALEALTLTPARLLGIEEHAGSLEVGKAAHIVAVEGDLFEGNGFVTATWIDGRLYESEPTKAKQDVARDDTDDYDLRQQWERRAPVPTPTEAPAVTAIEHATILTVTDGTIASGTILMRNGRIAAVGADADVDVPTDAHTIDATGQFVMPGIVDAHIHIAIAGGGNESSRSVTPEVRIADVIDHRTPSIYRALAGGVTTVNVLHGSANVIGGQNAVIKLRWGRSSSELFFEGAPEGIKFALGENPRQTNRRPRDGVPPRYPGTRMGVERTLRTSFTEAERYQKTWKDYESARARGDNPLSPRRDLKLEALVGVLEGRILVHAHCYRSDEILMLLRVAEDFGFRIASLQHVLEGYKVADEIAAHGAGASTFADGWGYKMEAFDAIPYNAALMASRGVTTSINSDAVGEMTARLYVQAAKTMKYGGVSEQEALKMVTLNPASHLGIEDRVGSIEVGKDADVAIYSAHPFSADAQVVATLIDGRVYFDRSQVETTRDALPLPTVTTTDDSERRGITERTLAFEAPSDALVATGFGDTTAPGIETRGVLAIVGGRIVTMTGPPIDNGTLIIRDGRIAALGADVSVPSGARTVNAEGLIVTPGLINAGTTIGITEIGAVAATQDARELGQINSGVKASVAVHPHSEMIPVTRVNGVTTAVTAPIGGLIAGQAALIDLDGWTAPELWVKAPLAMVIDFPEHSVVDPDEEARQNVSDDRRTLRDWMHRAQAHAGSRAAGRTESTDDDDKLQALVPVVLGEVPVLLEAQSEEGIRAALRFAEELGLRAILAATRDVWRVVDVIERSGVPVILGPLESRPAPGDPYDAVFQAASLLKEAGVPFAFRTGGATNARNLPYHAGLAVAFGLSRQDAWHAMTTDAASILGVSKDYGTLEVGKVANIVVSDGDLLDVATEVRHVFIRGLEIELSSRHTRLYEKFGRRPRPTSRGTNANQ